MTFTITGAPEIHGAPVGGMALWYLVGLTAVRVKPHQ